MEAVNVTFGAEEETCITPATGLTGGEYFKLSCQDTKYAVYTTVNSVGADPTVTGYTSVAVAVPTSYTVAEWITAFITAIEATDDFLAIASSDSLSVKVNTLDVGAVLETITDVDTSFDFSVLTTGFGGDLGQTKEGIEVSFEQSKFEVKSNQKGESVLDEILMGLKCSLSMSLLEMTASNWELVVGKGYGDTHTPSGGTKLIGFGDGRMNSSAFALGGKLILHPVNIASSDRTRDVVFHKCLPAPESINFDGTDTQAMSVTFNAYVDDSKDASINIFAFGDWRQDLR